MRNSKRTALLSLAACAAIAGYAHQATANTSYTWIGTGTTAAPTSSNWNNTASWYGSIIPPSGTDTQLVFGGSGGTTYTATDDITGAFGLNEMLLNSSASVAESIVASPTTNTLTFQNNSGSAGPVIMQSGSGAFVISPNILLSNTLAINGSGSGSITLGGIITGTSTGITLNDASTTVILSNSNTYSGTTTVSGGDLQLQNIAALTDSALNLAGGTLQLRVDTSKTFADASTTISATSTIDVAHLSSGNTKTLSLNAVSIGANTLNVTGSNSDILGTGAVTLNSTTGGTTTFDPTTAPLQTGAVSSAATGAGTIDTLDLDGTATNNSITGKISDGSLGGSLALSKTNSSTWTIAGNTTNNYSGGTTVSNGTLILNKSGGIDAIPSAGGLNISGGTVQLGASEEINNSTIVTISGSGVLNPAGFSETIKSLLMNGGTVGSTGTLIINTSGTTTVNSGSISSNLTTGTGDLTLGSGASISGTTTLLGDVVFNGTAAGATLGAFTITANRNFNITRGTSAVDLTLSGNISSTATSGTQTMSLLGGTGSSPNGNYAFNGNISNGVSGGTIAMSISDTGQTISFAGANSYSGGTTINSGTVILASSNSLDNTTGPLGPTSATVLLGKISGSGKAGILTSGAQTFANAITLQSGNSGTMTLGGSTDANSVFSGNISMGSPSGAGKDVTLVSVTTAANLVNFTGVIADPVGLTSGTAGTVNIGNATSTGIVQLSNQNTYTGGTALNFGTLAIGASSTGSVTSGPVGTGTLSVYGGTTLESIGTQSIGNKVDVGGTGASGDIGISFGGTGALTLNGGFVLSKSGINTITDNDTANVTIGGTVSGSGATLNKTGTGTLVLGHSNSYSGGTIVTAGNLRENANNGVPVGSPLQIGSGATFTLAGHDNNLFSLSDLLPSGGGGTLNFGTGGGNNFTISGLATTTFSGTMINASLATPAIVVISGGNNLTLTGQNTAFMTMGIQGSSEVTLGCTTGPAMSNLLSASMTTSGELLETQQNQINSSVAISVDSGGIFDTGGNNQTVASLSLGQGTVQTEAGTLTLGGDITYTATSTDTTALNGNIDLGGANRNINASNLAAPDAYTIGANFSDGGLTFTGTSTVNLAGASTYTGATMVNAGKLNVTGSLGNTAVQVASGAKFGGSGSVAGSVSIADGASLDLIDNAIHTLSVGSMTLGSAGAGMNYNLEVSTVGGVTTFDSVNVSGALSVNIGGVILNLTNLNVGTAPVNGTYTILSYNPTGSTTSPLFEFSNLTNTETFEGVTIQLANVSGAEEIIVGVAANPMWTNAIGDGSWNTAGNWTPAGPLNAVGAVANFTTLGAGVVTLDAPQTVGTINFNSSTSYTISAGAGGTLTINDPVSPQINVISGSHLISAPIILNNGVAVNFSGGTALQLTNTITDASNGTIAVGGAGTLTIGAGGVLPTGDALTLGTGAKVALAVGATNTSQTIASLSIDTTTGSQLDIGNNILNITGTPVATIAAYVNGTNSGGIYSSVADAHHNVGYIAVGGGTEVRYTLLGDTNLDGSVNFSDLLTLAQHYGLSGQTWSTGDTNYDGLVNFSDLLSLAQNYGSSVPVGSSQFSPSFAADWNLAVAEASAVPEPTSLGLLAMATTGFLARRRRIAG